MIRTLARLLNDPALANPNAQLSEQVFLIHPLQLSRWLEQAWSFGGNVNAWASLPNQRPYLGDSGIVASLQLPDTLNTPDTPESLLNELLRSGISEDVTKYAEGVNPLAFYRSPAAGQSLPSGMPWEHLIYALLIENTGVFEILAEVVRRYAVGETLEEPSLETQRWLRATEELFFRDPPLFHILGVTSQLRPDMRIARRNAYWRLFGMDCAHPLPPQVAAPGSDQVWKRDVGTANVRFHEIFVQLLQQVWVGIENVSNTSGSNPTDPAYIAQLCKILRDMFDMRRRKGQLAREEFVHVTTMSWFHLTVDGDTPLVKDLKATGTDPADRLSKIGQRVGITPPRQAREYFELAEPLSTLLRFIELGAFNESDGAQTLYSGDTSIQRDMNNVIDLWQSATGDSLKGLAVRVANQPRSAAQPQFLPTSNGVTAAVPDSRPGLGPVAINGRRRT
jgi:hypothetical protein